MDLSIWLGVLGIAVSIAVGWLTYWLASKRTTNQGYLNAKATVLQELSNPLGEDAVPTAEVIEATIRSVLRETGDRRVSVSIDDVLDDLVRRVTSDPFLDGERRRTLQAEIQNVRQQAATANQEQATGVFHTVITERPTALPLMSAAVMMASTLGLFLALFEGTSVFSSILKNVELSWHLLVGLLLPILFLLVFDDGGPLFRLLSSRRGK